MTHVLALVGSLRKDSHNRQLAVAAQEAAPAGTQVSIYDGLGAIPFYNEDLDGADAPVPATALRAAVAAADAIVLFTPEYNGTLPAVLKNAIDWVSRPYGQGAITGKRVAIVSASISPNAGQWALGDARRAIGVAGGTVVEEATLSIGTIGAKFADTHPRDHAESADGVAAVLAELVRAAEGELIPA